MWLRRLGLEPAGYELIRIETFLDLADMYIFKLRE